jgi:hypothetical protein
VDDAKLDLGLGEHGGNGVGKSGQPVNGGKENVLYPAVFKLNSLWYLGTICGSNVPSRSRGILTGIGPLSVLSSFVLFLLRRLAIDFSPYSCFS